VDEAEDQARDDDEQAGDDAGAEDEADEQFDLADVICLELGRGIWNGLGSHPRIPL